MITYIYALIDPRTDEVRYIGKSNYPASRLAGHIFYAKKEHNHKANWIRKLLANGMRPKLKVLEAIPNEIWPERESWWITKLRLEGARLINKTNGGEGSPGLDKEISEKIRKANIGRTHSEETRRKLSIANHGKEVPLELRERIAAKLRGVKRPKEVGEKISATRMGYRYSEDAVKNMKLSHSKLSDDVIRDIRQMVKDGNIHSVVAKKYYISEATISRIIHKRCYGWVE